MLDLLVKYVWFVFNQASNSDANFNKSKATKFKQVKQGAWIGKQSTHLTLNIGTLLVSLSLSDDKLFIGPKHNIYAFSWFYLVNFIWCYNLSVKFVMLIVKRKIEI